jgi:solute carrier family 25 iron transporter 28/37
MTVPFTAVQFSVYELAKKVLNPTGQYSPLAHMASGGLAGALGAAVTTPLDVCKTLLQTRGNSTEEVIRKANGMKAAASIIWQREGMRGFFRGLVPRIWVHAPSNAICWCVAVFSLLTDAELWSGALTNVSVDCALEMALTHLVGSTVFKVSQL